MYTVGTIDVMSPPQTLSRRALLSAGGGCFAGSFLLDSWLFDATATASDGAGWQQRWGDSTHRNFTAAAPDPTEIGRSWTATPEDSSSLTIECVGPDRVYVRDYDQIIAYRRDDGSEQWRYSANEGTLSLPTLVGETLVVQENGTAHAVAVDDGSTRWTGRFSPSQQPLSTTIALDGNVYLPGGSTYLEVHPRTGFHRRSFDSKTLGTLVATAEGALFWWAGGQLRATDTDGELQWQRSLGRSHPPSGRAIAVTDSAVVVRHYPADDGPTVTALDRDTGDSLWNTSEGIKAGVVVTAGPETVYVGSNLQLRALDRTTGRTRWTMPTDGLTPPQPVATPSTAYVPTTDGIVPVDPMTGAQRGSRLLSGQDIRSLAVVTDSVYAVADDTLVGLGVDA
jgi:outer membrane protein assembly factor BamB